MVLVFTLLWASNQAKAFTLDETLGFYRNLVVVKGAVSIELDKAKKKDFLKTKPQKDKDQALISRTDGVKCTLVWETWVFQGPLSPNH